MTGRCIFFIYVFNISLTNKKRVVIRNSINSQQVLSVRVQGLSPVRSLQVQFALAVLDGAVTLPSAAQMEREVRRQLQEMTERGVQRRHMMHMDQDQWEYCHTLARRAGFAPLPPVTRSLYEEVWRQRGVHPGNYRKRNYRLVSDTRWELID